MEGYAEGGIVFDAAVDVAAQNLVPNPCFLLFGIGIKTYNYNIQRRSQWNCWSRIVRVQVKQIICLRPNEVV